MTSLYLIRHAYAKWTPDENRPLSKQGWEGAVKLAELLVDQGINHIISSPARRAIQTAEPLAVQMKLAIQHDPRFRERELGDWTASSFEEAIRHTWDDMDFAYPNGETNRVAQSRALQALTEVLMGHPVDHVLISTHGNLLALMLKHYLPRVDFSFWQRLTIPDAYHLEIVREEVMYYSRIWNEVT